MSRSQQGGVVQGCIITMVVFIDNIVREAKQRFGAGVMMGTSTIQLLLFADESHRKKSI